ncbi:unnamed protein product [Rotaria sp. Silwood2]|nr:unnamed protein product [Rotaria sp. Silwood2]CAF4007901.1 unnamed protein product [Rotaria sp. Silwood2]CAF4470665.1 unnamed protein product [Rotaria sp. Silwood2]
MSTLNAQESRETSNHFDEQMQISLTLSIFTLDYKSALRVLFSIHVPTIVTIMMLAIRDAVDPALKGELILIIANLFGVNDNAVKALEHICPKQIDLIRKNHRRLCNLLVDIDEWK